MRLRFLFVGLLAFCLCLCGCDGLKQAPTPPASSPSPSLRPSPMPTPTPSPTPRPTPVPTPTPLPEGNFSWTFPAEDTGEEAKKSYQSEDVRVAIRRFSEKGVIYFVADIWIRDISSLRTAFAKDKFGGGRQSIKTLMKNHNAIVALSGDYYGARSRGVVIRNGEEYRDTPLYDVCVLYRNGEMKTYSNDEWEAIEETAAGVYQAWGFGPMLLDKEANPLTEFNGFTYHKHNPRAAIGYYEPGHYCFVAVEGRNASRGMLLKELSQLFHDLGCKTAYNLDGGATAILAYEGKYVNEPSSGGRSQYDIIYIARPEEPQKGDGGED